MKNTSWFMKYQPQSVEDYVFENDFQKEQVLKWMQEEQIPGNLILYGPAGTGKTALSELLIKAVSKHQQDLNVVLDLSVKNIDELTNWLEKRPVKSKQKIVYLEEFDRLSPQARNSLKNRKMEKYQEHCSFICTTNFFSRIERALQTRFTFQFNMNNPSREGTFNRLTQILTSEKVIFDPEKLRLFVDNNIQIGLRDMINTLQINTINNQIDLNQISVAKSEQEDEVIQNTKRIFQLLIEGIDANQKKLALVNPINSVIGPNYSSLINTIQYNHNIDYINVFLRLDEELQFLPIKRHINMYMNQLESKQLMPHIHYLAFLYDCMKCIVEINF